MKNNKGFAPVLALLIVLGIIAVGGVVYYVGTKNNFAAQNVPDNNYQPTNQNNLVGGDKDAHGCIGSAGYSWCAVKNKCLRVWEEKCEATPVVSTILPIPYISAQSGWPPVIKDSSTPYSCISTTSEMEKIVQKTIGNRTYCIVSNSDGAMGRTYSTYTYTTSNGSGIKTTNFTLIYLNCGVYGDQPTVDKCQATQSNFNLDAIINSLM